MTKTLLKVFFTFTLTIVLFLQKVEARGFAIAHVNTDYVEDANPYGFLTGNEKFISKYYPNPARDYITFEFDKKIGDNCRLIIYSFTGRKMTETQVSNLKITVNLTDYFRGLYLFQLISPQNQVLESGKFQVLK